MNEFFPATIELKDSTQTFTTLFDAKRARFTREQGAGVVELSLDDPDQVFHSEQVSVEEIEQLTFFLRDNQDIIRAKIKGKWVEIEENMDKLFETPSWLKLPWINLSQVCLMLYGKKDKSTTAYFTLKRQGKRPWKTSELEKLEEIRQQIAVQLTTA